MSFCLLILLFFFFSSLALRVFLWGLLGLLIRPIFFLLVICLLLLLHLDLLQLHGFLIVLGLSCSFFSIGFFCVFVLGRALSDGERAAPLLNDELGACGLGGDDFESFELQFAELGLQQLGEGRWLLASSKWLELGE